MAFTLNRRLAQLIDGNGQLNTGKIPNDYITSDHVADNTITSAMLHTSFTVSTSNLTSIDTDDVSEGSSNLYYTNARARGAVSATGSLSYNSSTGAFSFTQGDTDTVSEGSTNLYFTNARVDTEINSYLSGGTGVTYSSGAISIGQDVGTSATPTFGNITTTGYIAGPATFTIDPAAVGDNTGTVVIAGNLQVDGTTTTINSTTVNIDDLNIQLATGAANAAAADGAGITVDGASATITYDGTNDRWDFNKFIEIGSGYGGTPNTDSQLILNDSGNNYITIGSGASSEGGILFADSGDNDVGVISYNHSTDILNVTAPNGIQFNDKLHIVASDPVTNQTLIEFLNTSGYGIYARTNSIGARGNTLEFIASDYNNNSAQTHEVLTLRPEGNVSIGTTSSSGKLHIQPANSDTLQTAIFTRQNNAAGTDGNSFSLRNDAANNFVEMNSGGTNNGGFKFYRGNFSADPALTIVGAGATGGYVGIGTDNPALKLHVSDSAAVTRVLIDNTSNATAGSGIYLRTLNSGSMVSNATVRTGNNGDFSIWTGTTGEGQRLTIDGSGNVGIGTTDPTGKFEVNGGRMGVISTDSSWGQFRVGNTGDGEVGMAFVNGATESDFLADTNPACAYKVILGINPYGAGTRNFGIGNDTMENYHTFWSEAGHQLPRVNNTFDLGSGAQSFRNIHTDNIGIGRGDGPHKKLDVRNSITTAGSHVVAHIGGNNHAAGYAVGLGFDPEGYGYRNKIAIFAEGTGLGYSRGRLHFALRGGANSDEAAITDSKMCILENGNIGIGSQIDAPGQLLTVATSTNYDPPGLGNSNATFSVLKKDNAAGGNYGIITGISNDGNVWSQVQRVDGTATGYNYYLQPSGGSVGIGIPQNHPYIPNLLYPLRVGKTRTGTGNVTDYLSKIAIDGLGYGGSNYQMAALDFTGGDTAGKSGNLYGRIGCSSMVGTNNQEVGSLEFYAAAPGFSPTGTTHAMKITGQANTASAGGGTTRNGVLFTYQGLAIDRSWADYPSINVMNSTPYSSTTSTQSELRIHGNNVSSASYPAANGSDFSCTVRADGGYVTGSDRRRKRNITTIDNALDTVKQLTGKRFQTVNRSEEVQEHVSKNGYKLGFIAQEVEDIIPEAVQYHADEDDGTENWNSSYAMDYGSVVALLVNAIKEQDTTIQDLKTRIETLEG